MFMVAGWPPSLVIWLIALPPQPATMNIKEASRSLCMRLRYRKSLASSSY
jgi:hypothetical protein